MGCVYMTVDKRYYHNNNEPEAEQYFEINLQPGYQRLCGKQALEFVANRHESTSLIRDARDQRFLLDVKAQYGPRSWKTAKSSSGSSAGPSKPTSMVKRECCSC